MKKFLVFVMIAIVGLGIGFAAFRFTVKQQVIKVDTTPVECNSGDAFSIDVEIRNKKSGTTVTVVSDNPEIVAASNTAGEEYKFEAKKGGVATITVTSNLTGFVPQKITVTVGDGSSENLALRISSVQQFNRIGTDGTYSLDKCYKLISDLSFNGNYKVLGNFSGKFDFAGHRISDIAVDTSDTNDGENFGLFAALTKEAVVKNLVLTDFTARGGVKTGKVNIGAIAGYSAGIIRDVHIGRVTIEDGTSQACIGGIVGNNNGTIKRVQAEVVTINRAENSVIGEESIVGGIVGINSTSAAQVYACGVSPIIGGGLYVGGIAGQNDSATIENCAVGKLGSNYEVVSDVNTAFVGGIVGYNLCKTARASVADCYALVRLGTVGNRGAIVGKNENNIIVDTQFENPIFGCYYVQDLTGVGINAINMTVDKDGNAYEYSNQNYIEYISAKTEEQLKDSEGTYVSYKQNKGAQDEVDVLWQFGSVWSFIPGNVPTLNFNDAGVYRVLLFVAASSDPSIVDIDQNGNYFNENTNYRITKDITITSPIQKYNAVMEGVKKANGEYPTVTFEYSNFDGDWAALFGELGQNGHIQNLNFDIRISADEDKYPDYYACLVAHNKGEVNNCTMSENSRITVTKNPTNSTLYVGGIVAENKGQVLNSNHLGTISVSIDENKTVNVGGIVGKSFEDASIQGVRTGTNAIAVGRGFVGYVGGICGVANSSIENSKNYSPVVAIAGSDSYTYAVGGIVGFFEGKGIHVSRSANFGALTSKIVGGVIGISSSFGSADGNNVTIFECMSQATLSGLKVGGIAYEAVYGIYRNNLSKNHLIGANGQEDRSIVAGLIYHMNVTSGGITRAYNCVSDNTFGNAGTKYYEDANFSVYGRKNKASILRGGYHAEPIAAYDCVDVYALTNCYVINKGDESVIRTDGWDFEYATHNGLKVGSSAGNVDINAKSDHLVKLGDQGVIAKMMTATTERLIVKLYYFSFWRVGSEERDLQVDPFSDNIWSITENDINLKAFVE